MAISWPEKRRCHGSGPHSIGLPMLHCGLLNQYFLKEILMPT
jgi:hypothetical protein